MTDNYKNIVTLECMIVYLISYRVREKRMLTGTPPISHSVWTSITFRVDVAISTSCSHKYWQGKSYLCV
jgi:hypothetical protein